MIARCCFGDRCVIDAGRENCIIDWEGTWLIARDGENQGCAKRVREAIWIKRTPNNMNRHGGAFQLFDSCDAAIAKTTSSGNQKGSGLLQSANQHPRKMAKLGCDIRTFKLL